MAVRIRPWHALGAALALVAVTAAAVMFVVNSRPPNYTTRGFTSLRCVFPNHDKPPLEAMSGDAALVAAVAEALRAGWEAGDCKCAGIAQLEFRHPDGTTAEVSFVPAHDLGTVEFRTGGRRYRTRSAAFLRVVEPLGMTPERWTGSGRGVKPKAVES